MSHPPECRYAVQGCAQGHSNMQLHLWGAIPGTGSGSGRPLELLPALHKAGPTQGLPLSIAPVH